MPGTSLQGGHKCIMALRSAWSRQAQGVSRYMVDISWDKAMNTINNLGKLSQSQGFMCAKNKTDMLSIWIRFADKAGIVTFRDWQKCVQDNAICTDVTSTHKSKNTRTPICHYKKKQKNNYRLSASNSFLSNVNKNETPETDNGAQTMKITHT